MRAAVLDSVRELLCLKDIEVWFLSLMATNNSLMDVSQKIRWPSHGCFYLLLSSEKGIELNIKSNQNSKSISGTWEDTILCFYSSKIEIKAILKSVFDRHNYVNSVTNIHFKTVKKLIPTAQSFNFNVYIAQQL